MNRNLSLLLALASLTGLVSPVDDTRTVQLRLRLTPGETYYQRTVIEQRVVVTASDRQRTTNSRIGTGLEFEVLKRDDTGVHTLRVTYDWIRIRTRQGQTHVDFDSAVSLVPGQPDAVPYAAQVGRSFVMSMAADGRILEFEGLAAMHERMAARITEMGGRGDAYLPWIRQQFGERSMRDGLGLIATVLPKKAVEVGDEWTTTSSNTAGFSRDTEATYRLASVEDGNATIVADVTIRPARPDKAEPGAARPAQWYEMGGTDKGVYRVDAATGWIVGGETEQVLTGTTHTRRGGREIVSDIDITGTTQLTSSRDAPTTSPAQPRQKPKKGVGPRWSFSAGGVNTPPGRPAMPPTWMPPVFARSQPDRRLIWVVGEASTPGATATPAAATVHGPSRSPSDVAEDASRSSFAECLAACRPRWAILP
jgi:hypothetical protein